MKQFTLVLMLVLSAYATLPGNVNTIKFDINWTINYSIDKEFIYVEAVGANKGGIAIAFGGNKMSNMDIAYLWYDNGVKLVDRNHINPPKMMQMLEDTQRTPAGTDDWVDTGSTFDDVTGNWKASFKRKLNTGDVYDTIIVDGQEMQVAIALFGKQGWGGKHITAKFQTVKLTSESTDKKVIDNTTDKGGDKGDEKSEDKNKQDEEKSKIETEEKSFSSLIQQSISCLLTIVLVFF